MKYYIKVFGCQMNYSDAERIETILNKYKIKKAASIEAADLIVFVTCGVRQSAEDRVYGQIHNLRKKYPGKKIILTGCLAHRKDVQRRSKGKVDLFTTIKDFKKDIVSCITYNVSSINKKSKIHNTLYKIQKTKNLPCSDYLRITPKYSNSHVAYVPIMTGCNNFCAYCVVPYARGREYSRPVENILKEVKSLVKKGCKEIILLGQNVNSYQSFYKNKNINFPELLGLIEAIPAKRSEAPHQTAESGFGARGNFWLSFLTSHPKDMSDDLIETIARSKKICGYISLPAQSGDDEILKKMNRHYTIAHYRNLIKKIRQTYRRELSSHHESRTWLSPTISTDIIVGFPGETKKQFENTAELLREMKFDMVYVSQYSPRPETAAWKLKDNISKKEKVRREKVLTEILEKTALENNKKYIGKTVEVLVDKRFDSMLSFGELRVKASEKKNLALEPNKYLAHTRTQKKIIITSTKKIPVGSFQKVRITKAKAFGLKGEII